jgi:hypothetical protein
VGSKGRSDDLIIAGRESGIERSAEYPQREWIVERPLGMVDCWCSRAENGGWISRAVFQGYRVSDLCMLG